MFGIELTYIYGAFLLFGVAYALIATLLGSLGGDHGGGHFDAGHDVAGGHIDASAGDSEHSGLSPFSPLMIATFATLFGGIGFITLGILENIPLVGGGIAQGLSVVISAVLAVICSGYFSYLLVSLFVKTQSGGVTSTSRLIGCEAEVSLDMVPGKIGEVTYLHGGSRQNGMAMLVEGARPVKKGQCVEIVSIKDNILYVKPVDKSSETTIDI